MSAPELLRVAVVGATGTVGRELIGLLQERRFPIQRMVPVATDDSLGLEIAWLGHDLPVEVEAPPLPELDLVWLCAPAPVALDWIRDALRSEVPCFDLSAALSDRGEVPLGLAAAPGLGWGPAQPLMAGPAGPALLLAPVLRALDRAAGLARATATVLESASSAGRPGVEALQEETLALFQQRDAEASDVFPKPLAFDCLPAADAAAAGPSSDRETRLVAHLTRLLSGSARISITALRVPTFAGCGIQLAVETERELQPAEAVDCLSKTAGISGQDFPTTRGSVGSDEVAVARVRPDPAAPEGRGLHLWLAGDPVRLAASNALELARQRFAGAEASGA
ncbi:MAG: hypothetical protein CL910_15715 [Deltaproteobacteria bacterium]|nr:hypothetical protein [Deltaproteobacteria bacterium]